jgi:hypothetical protein
MMAVATHFYCRAHQVLGTNSTFKPCDITWDCCLSAQLQVTAVGRTDKHTEWPLTDGDSERACLLTWELYGESRSCYFARLQIHCPTVRLHDLVNNI